MYLLIINLLNELKTTVFLSDPPDPLCGKLDPLSSSYKPHVKYLHIWLCLSVWQANTFSGDFSLLYHLRTVKKQSILLSPPAMMTASLSSQSSLSCLKYAQNAAVRTIWCAHRSGLRKQQVHTVYTILLTSPHFCIKVFSFDAHWNRLQMWNWTTQTVVT